MKCVYEVAVTIALACCQVYAQQDEMDARRSRVTQETDEAERVCHASFAVNDCLKKVQVRQRQQMADIKREETALHDRQRKEQAAEQSRQAVEKQVQREQQLMERSGGVVDADARQAQQDDKRRLHQGNQRIAGGKASHADPGHKAPQALQGYRSEWERKQQEAEKKRMDRDRRLQDKAKSKPVPGLPTTPP